MLKFRHSKEIISIFLTILLVSTIFSTITIAKEETNKGYIEADVLESQKAETKETYLDSYTSSRVTFKTLIQSLGIIRDGISPFYIFTKLNESKEKRTKMRLLLPTSIDIDGDKDFDVRVWCFRLPSIDLRPPALAIKTYLIVRRLPGMNDIKDDAFEIYLEYKPKIISKITGDIIEYIRLGYQSPAGEEVPRTCIITHKTIPHFLYPRKKTTHKIAINPLSITGKEQLNLLFSIAEPGNETNNDTFELNIQVNHTPAVKNEIVFDRYKEKFLSRAQTLDITRKDVDSDVSILIKQLMGKNASLSIDDIPKKLTLSWLLARTGYVELNTHENDLGRVELVVEDIIMLGFIPKKSLYAHIGWQDLGIRSFTQRKPFNLFFDAEVSIEILDFYVKKPKLQPFGLLPYNLELNASYISLDLGVDVDVGNLTISFTYENLTAKVKNLNAVIEDLSINLEDIESNGNESIQKVETTKRFQIYFDYISFLDGEFNIYLDNANLVKSGEIKGALDIDDCSLTVVETVAVYTGDMGAVTTTTETTASLSSLDAVGSFYLALSTQTGATTFSADIDGYLKLTCLDLEGINIEIGIDLINISGDSSISTQPFPENALTYFGLKYESNGGFVEIDGVTTSGGNWLDLLDMLDYVYVGGHGDVKAEIWKDSEPQDVHLYIESQNGLTLDLFKITFDHGLKFEITRSGTMQGHIGSGYAHVAFNIDGDGDGYVFFDSSEIEFEDVLLSYWRSGLISTGFRFSPSINYIDADFFLLQWDSVTLGSENTTIPYNWYLTGSISAGIDIDIFVGDQWYDLWPMGSYGTGAVGLETIPVMAPAGTGSSPNKPLRPVGPPGYVLEGRVVKGHSYTYSTATIDPDGDQVYYMWDWGDGTYSDWSVPFSSEVGVTGSHIWTATGIYNVRVKAKDINGNEGDWSDPLEVTVRNPINSQEVGEDQTYENQSYNTQNNNTQQV